MVREIITLNIGGCGIQFGQSVAGRYCNEYNIQPDGTLEQKNDNDNPSINKFFEEDSRGTYFARNLFCDLDCDPSNDTKCQMDYHNIMPNGSNSFFGKEDGANIFSRGYNADIIDPFYDKLRMAIDGCDNFQGFMINHSITGAAGSGLSAQILQRIAVDYRRKTKIGFEICPVSSGNKDCNVLDPYNMAISVHKLIDDTDASIMFDNKALYNIARNNLNMYNAEYKDLNSIVSKYITAITYPLRDIDAGNYRLQELSDYQTHFVPFPRLCFLTPSMYPIKPKYHPVTLIDGYIRESYSQSYKVYNDIRSLLYNSYCINEYKLHNDTIQSVTENILHPNNFLMDFPDFNVDEHLYISCLVDYTLYNNGKPPGIQHKHAKNICCEMKRTQEKLKFVEWVPNGFECMIHDRERKKNENNINANDMILDEDINGVMLGNNTYFGKWCKNRIIEPFNLLFEKRAFVHWFYDNKFEENDFLETREDLFFLQQDYDDIVSEDVTDDEEYDYDENDFIISAMTEEQMFHEAIKNSLN